MQFSKWITLGFGALCLILVAGVLRAQHLYFMAAILLTLPGISYLLGWQAMRGLTFARRLPPTAWEGEEGVISYEVRNATRLARFFLSIHEPLPSWIVAATPAVPLFNVGAQETTHVQQSVKFRKRGVYRVQYFDVTAMDPLGVFAFSKRVPSEEELVVYPAAQPLAAFTVTGSERHGWNEFTASAFQGSSVEPDGVRAYVQGDSLRRVHWQQTARTGRLTVIDFEETQAIDLTIALDLLRGSETGRGTETTLEYGVRLAASLVQQAASAGANVRLLVPDSEEVSTPLRFEAAQSGRGQAHLLAIYDTLARVQASSQQPLAQLLIERTSALTNGTTLVVVTPQPEAGLGAVLSGLSAQGANVAVVYIDPASFETKRRQNGAPAPAPPTADVMAVMGQARLRGFVLRQNKENRLLPEAFHYAGAN